MESAAQVATPAGESIAGLKQPGDSEAKDAYETLLRCRDLELSLQVERSNLCLVIEGALFAFAAPTLVESQTGSSGIGGLIGVAIAAFGLALSLLSVSVVKGANFWINYWERRLGEVEASVFRTIAIFKDHPSKANTTLLKRLAELNLKYVSSRDAILRLFWFLTVVWSVLLLFGLWRLAFGQVTVAIFTDY